MSIQVSNNNSTNIYTGNNKVKEVWDGDKKVYGDYKYIIKDGILLGTEQDVKDCIQFIGTLEYGARFYYAQSNTCYAVGLSARGTTPGSIAAIRQESIPQGSEAIFVKIRQKCKLYVKEILIMPYNYAGYVYISHDGGIKENAYDPRRICILNNVFLDENAVSKKQIEGGTRTVYLSNISLQIIDLMV